MDHSLKMASLFFAQMKFVVVSASFDFDNHSMILHRQLH